MSKLHEVIEAINTKRILVANGIDDNFSFAAIDIFKQKNSNAMCFDMGEVESITSLKMIHELVRLPYEICWFEGNSKDGAGKISIIGTLCWTETIDEVSKLRGLAFTKDTHGRWMFRGYWQSNSLISNSEPVVLFPFNSKEYLEAYRAWILYFLIALNCSNIRRVEHKSSEALQKSRKKKGKQPLFSYWTLELNLTKGASEITSAGGTHASPRLHLRRGHPRKYASGKWIWIDPCMVGNKKLGMIHKEYAATYE